MMGLFTLINLVLIVKFIGVQSEFPNTDVVFGKGVSLWESGWNSGIHYVNAIRNNVTYNLLDKLNDVHMCMWEIEKYYEFGLKDVNFDHAGKWIINSSIQRNEEKIQNYDVVHLRITKPEQKLLPTNYLIGEEGTYVTVYFEENFDNITNCTLTPSDKSKEYILSDRSNDAISGLGIPGQCGFRMFLNSSWPNKWTLSQENEKSCVMTAEFTVYYVSKSEPPQQKSEIWNLGSRHTLIKVDYESNFCELEQPNGEIISVDSDRCDYTVNQVNYSHAGTWKVRYVPSYTLDVIKHEVIVTVIDPQEVNCSVTTEDNGIIHLQCQTYLEGIDYCRFTTPSGNGINVVPGIGNEKYEYYGTTYRTIAGKNFSQCGLTIRNPTDGDKGFWKCTIRSTAGFMNTITTYVPINDHEKKEVEGLHITTHQVFTKVDDDFTIKCEIERSLDYCTLRSPDGTIYSVTKNRGNVPNYLPYTGAGLSAGVCGAHIEKANETHDGDWTCRLGVSSEDKEIEATVSVTVADTYVMPLKKTINITIDQEPKLLVSILPNKGLTIKFCRWVHPNGQRFHERNVSKYPREQNSTSCSISLREVNQEDIGTWRCYVVFDTGSDEETYTSIEVVNGGQTKIFKLLHLSAVILSAVTIICCLICGYFIYKNRNKMQAEVPQTSQLTKNEFESSNWKSITVKENMA